MVDITEIPGRRMLKMNFQNGVAPLHLWAFFPLCWTGIMLATFTPSSQAYLFTEFLNVPFKDHGKLGGSLAFWGEIVFLAVAGLWGALSDKIGRRRVIAVSFALMAVGVFIYSCATTVVEVYPGRLIFAAGAAAYSVMIVALIADYAMDDSRGKLMGWHGFFNGLGAMAAVLLFAKLPQIMKSRGMDSIEAGQFMYMCVFTVAIVTAIIAWFGLKKDEGTHIDHPLNFRKTLTEGFKAGKKPRILLAYVAGFISRGNLTIVGTFFILWLSNHGSQIGMDRADAFARGGMIVGIAQFFALLGAPIFGIMTDRMDRVTALIVSLVFSAIGYCSTYFVADPFSWQMIICAAMIGLGEVAVIITSAVLIAEEAPSKIRGAVIGFFTICGALGIMVAAKLGGRLFDDWNPVGPFVLFGGFAIIVGIWAIILRSRDKKKVAV